MTKLIKKSSQRLFALLLSVAMILSVTPIVTIAETQNTASIEIRTVEDLYNIRNDLTANYILMNDIDLTEATAEGGAWDFMGNGWNPIGSGNVYGKNAFSGEFNGNGHTITGLRINITSLPAGTTDLYVGLFSNVTGTIKNLSLCSNILAKMEFQNIVYMGGVAGWCEGSVDGITTSGSITYDVVRSENGSKEVANIGGIVGYAANAGINASHNGSEIVATFHYNNTNSKNYTSTVLTGGIVGSAESCEISKCYNAGSIVAVCSSAENNDSSSYNNYRSYVHSYVSGLLGKGESVTINDSYNAGNVSTTADEAYAAGIANGNNRISTCYNVGNITAKKNCYAIGSGTLSNCYYLANTGNSTDGAASLTESQMKLQSVFIGFDFESTWVQNADAIYPYPQLRNDPQDLRVIKSIELVSLPTKTAYAYGEPFQADGCVIELLLEDGKERVTVTDDMVTGYDAKTVGAQTLTITYLGKIVTFSVTVSEKVYVPISTIEELYNIRKNLNGNYILVNDIDFTAATAKGGDWDFMGNGWNPIGSEDVYGNSAFSGEFEGNGHRITGLRIDVTALPNGTTDVYLGLFANVSGSVRNLIVEGIIRCSCDKNTYVGSIAGISSGVIENCKNQAYLTAAATVGKTSGYVGGFAGAAVENATFVNCANLADIESNGSNFSDSHENGAHYAGGILGKGVSTVVINRCYNTGSILASAKGYSNWGTTYPGFGYAAGICEAAQITDCYNAGIIATKAYFKGEVYAYGIGGEATRCYNTGMVSGDSRYGISSVPSTDCYYLNESGTSSDGATALTETQMKLKTMFSGFDFDKVWVLNEYANYPYPQLRSNIQDLDESASLVSIISWPIKTEYMLGDALVLDGCMIDVTYVSGHKELLSVTADMVSGYDSATVGEQVITVTYRGSSDTFPVTVVERPEITSLELIAQPSRTEFRIGTQFDFSGAKIQVVYTNGVSEVIHVTVDMTTGGNINHLGKQTITVEYYGKTVTFEVTVTPVGIESLKMESLPTKTEYLEGEALDLTGMVLVAIMNNDTEKQVSAGYTVDGYSSNPGRHTITIGYMGKTVSFEVTVNEKSVVSLVLKAAPKKTEYIAGQPFDPAGMMIIATYDNGDVEVVEEYVLSGFDNTPGLKTVIASYGGKYVAFPVSVIARIITDFRIVSFPVKTEYLQYDAFDPTELVVQATYNDGITETVTDYEIVGYSSNPGTHTVSVAYGGWVDTFSVKVSPRELVALVVEAPEKLTYFINEEFDATGLTVTACYNNGQRIVVEDYTITGFDSSAPGTKKIIIGYGGLTSEFSISVNERSEIVTDGSFTVGNRVGRLGDKVVIPVSVSKNTGIAGFTHTISFNAADLRFVSVVGAGTYGNGTFVVNDEKAANGEITVLWFNNSDVVNSGDVYYLTFEVLETAKDGHSGISISFDANDNGNISGENVLFGAVNGYVDVRSYWLGDLNGDRKYGMDDLLQLAQYVSGKTMTLTEKQKLSADVNEDGIIDIHDVVLLNQWLLAADM